MWHIFFFRNQDRMTVQEALSHPWITGVDNSVPVMEHALSQHRALSNVKRIICKQMLADLERRETAERRPFSVLQSFKVHYSC
jgi:hypothetical protein